MLFTTTTTRHWLTWTDLRTVVIHWHRNCYESCFSDDCQMKRDSWMLWNYTSTAKHIWQIIIFDFNLSVVKTKLFDWYVHCPLILYLWIFILVNVKSYCLRLFGLILEQCWIEYTGTCSFFNELSRNHQACNLRMINVTNIFVMKIF